MKKKHIVFIVDDYLPYPTANGNAVLNIVKELQEDFEITILCQFSDSSQKENELINGSNIYRCLPKNRLERINSNSNFGYKVAQVKKYLNDIVSIDSIDKDLVNKFFDSLIVINKKSTIDYIFPICFPFESIVASVWYKEKAENLNRVKIIPIIFDKFSESKTRHRNNLNRLIKMKRNLNIEKTLYSSCSKVLVTSDCYNSVKSLIDNNKIIQIDLPFLTKKNINVSKYVYENDKHTMAYFGSINKKIRPIDNFCRILNEYNKNHNNLVFNFFGPKKDLNKLINSMELYPENIKINRYLSPNDVLKQYEKNEILCSIGNVDFSQTPSKIFEYMSTGKPIVHFFANDKDSVINIIDKYPNGININMNECTNNQIEKLFDFITKLKQNLDFSEVEKIFPNYNPLYIANIIKKNIYN